MSPRGSAVGFHRSGSPGSPASHSDCSHRILSASVRSGKSFTPFWMRTRASSHAQFTIVMDFGGVSPSLRRAMKLSVVMPVYKERSTLREGGQKVLSVPMEIELICVDAGAVDGSLEILAELQSE